MRGAGAVLITLGVTPLLLAAQPRPPRGGVDGVVYDSVAMRPLRGALVQLLKHDDPTVTRTMTADSLGRFRFDTVTSGTWVLGALHPRLDTLGVQQFARAVTVNDKGRTRTTLAIPSTRSLVTRVCGAATANDSLGYLLGSVRRTTTERPMGRATVRVQWMELEIGSAGITRAMTGFEQSTTEQGDFIACGIPSDVRVQVQAGLDGDSTGVLEVVTSGEGITRLDLWLGPVQRRQVSQVVRIADSTGTVADTITQVFLTGPGRVRGVVSLPARPLPNARVAVWGTGIEVRTDSSGRFELGAMPLGTHTLETRAVGYEPQRQLVDISAGDIGTTRVSLAPIARLDTVRIRANTGILNRRFDEEGFERRRRQGWGTFVGPEDLAAMNPMTLSDLFIRAPMVQVTWAPAAGEQLSMGAGVRRCTPGLFLDGRELDPAQFPFFARASDIVALEVYPRLNGTPPQFVSNRNLEGPGCGSIVAWTGARPKPLPDLR